MPTLLESISEPMTPARLVTNLPAEFVTRATKIFYTFVGPQNSYFSSSIGNRLLLTELTIHDEKRPRARAVFEIVIREDMLDGEGALSNGCIAYLVDM